MRPFRKYILSVIAMFFVLLGFFSMFSYEMTRRHIDEAKKERVSLLAEVITNGLKSIMMDGRPKEEFQRFLDGFAAEDIRSVRIFSDRGIILSSTVPGEVGRTVDAQHLEAFKARKGSLIIVHKSQDIKVYSSIMVMSNDWPCQRCHGVDDDIRAIVDLEVMQSGVDSLISGYLGWTIFAFLAGAGMLSFVFVLITSARFSRPYEKMFAGIRAISGNSKSRISPTGSDEFDTLAAAVNGIADDLESARNTVHLLESREMSQLEKMASIGEVAATVAHEIKNPLAGISGAIQVMAEDMPPDSPRKEICTEILSEIGRLDLSVKELIAFARPQELNPVSLDLNLLVNKAVEGIRADAESMGITVNLFPEQLPEVMADPLQLEKVVKDVIFYQMQLMPDGGTVSVSTEYDQNKDEVMIISLDTAPALTADRIKTIFRPSFSTKHTGTGLGLAVSRNIIESHGGRIWMESEPGKGNSFHIIIPGKRH